jgi:hypothetical protein
MTDRALARWLATTFEGVAMPYPIVLRHFDLTTGALEVIATLGQQRDSRIIRPLIDFSSFG